jgi:hypothetical protein
MRTNVGPHPVPNSGLPRRIQQSIKKASLEVGREPGLQQVEVETLRQRRPQLLECTLGKSIYQPPHESSNPPEVRELCDHEWEDE